MPIMVVLCGITRLSKRGDGLIIATCKLMMKRVASPQGLLLFCVFGGPGSRRHVSVELIKLGGSLI